MNDINVLLGKEYDVYSGKPCTVWRSRDGRSMAISEMADPHLVNAINYVRRRYHPMLDLEEAGTNPIGVGPSNKMSLFPQEIIDAAGSKLANKFASCLSHVRSMVDNPKYKHLWAEALKRGLVDERN